MNKLIINNNNNNNNNILKWNFFILFILLKFKKEKYIYKKNKYNALLKIQNKIR